MSRGQEWVNAVQSCYRGSGTTEKEDEQSGERLRLHPKTGKGRAVRISDTRGWLMSRSPVVTQRAGGTEADSERSRGLKSYWGKLDVRNFREVTGNRATVLLHHAAIFLLGNPACVRKNYLEIENAGGFGSNI